MTPLLDSLIGTLALLLTGGYIYLGGILLVWIDDHAKYKKTFTGVTIFLWIWGIMLVVTFGHK